MVSFKFQYLYHTFIIMMVSIDNFNRYYKKYLKKIERVYYPFHLNTTIPAIITAIPINLFKANLI